MRHARRRAAPPAAPPSSHAPGSHLAEASHADLKARCEAAGQEQLLEDWDALSDAERASLAEDIQVRCMGAHEGSVKRGGATSAPKRPPPQTIAQRGPNLAGPGRSAAQPGARAAAARLGAAACVRAPEAGPPSRAASAIPQPCAPAPATAAAPAEP
jgi:hypothetical protein